ncbi:DUF2252 domain-containing protein [Polyangium sorediatum]|uniref:DUF2252 domain-containing protein n=1 Tax=Polyangium sorediatum TaxID=889274 RepID=A0ABT6P9K6_9BACT|nr:DUF2252 domain-containing protein [Polyangium sorediatum]MDI1437293.1 DUF2252 domain-containing protein [Polyangium sorediatum]
MTETAEGSSAVTGARATPHLSAEGHAARGKAEREKVPRTSHATWEAPLHRPDPITLLEEQAKSRVPELVPLRYGRMLVSPFTFYRGAAYVMASDLATTLRSGLTVQLCGDAHLSNFGVFGSPERRMMFDINDFDETLPGPWDWDVKRLAASIELCGRDHGFSKSARADIVQTAVREYREAMRSFAKLGHLDLWYTSLDIERVFEQFGARVGAKRLKVTEHNVAKARTKDSLQAYEKLTHEVDGRRRILSDPPLIIPMDEFMKGVAREQLEEQVRALLHGYRATLQADRRHLLEGYDFVDMAHKVVGVGSVGTRAWILLLLGRDDEDPLFLQAKEAHASVLEPFLGKSEYPNSGQRVVAGERLMQAASDIFLGWQRVKGAGGIERDFYVRQLRDWKFSVDVAALDRVTLTTYGSLCGWTLARAHARSGDRIAIAAYLGKGDTFDEAIGAFAIAYADQTERDHQALVDAVKSGRIQAETGL